MKDHPTLLSVEAERLRVKEILKKQTGGEKHLERRVLRTIVREARKNPNLVFATLYLAEALGYYTHSIDQKNDLYEVIALKVSCCKMEVHLPLMQCLLIYSHDSVVRAACTAALYGWSMKNKEIASADWCWEWYMDNEEAARESITLLNQWGLSSYFKIHPNQFDNHPKKQKQKRRKNRNRLRRDWSRVV